MDSELQKKLKQAESLRKKPGFFMSMFVEADYIGSGELYCEIARGCEGVEDKEKFYKEAATTFLMKSSEYNSYRASECYKKLFDVLENVDLDRAIGYYILHAEYQEKTEKFLMAGQAYMKIAEIVQRTDEKRATSIYKKAYATYRKDVSCPYHAKEAIQKCLTLQLKNEELAGAIESFGSLNTKYSRLSRQILCFLQGKEDFEDDLDREESEVIMALLNKEKEECTEVLENFRKDNYLPEHASLVFDIAIARLKPENDIC